MMGAVLSLLLCLAGPQDSFSFRVECVKDTYLLMEPIAVKYTLKNVSDRTYYLDMYNAIYDSLEFHLYELRSGREVPKFRLKVEVDAIPLSMVPDIKFEPGDSEVSVSDIAIHYVDTSLIMPGVYVYRVRPKLNIVGEGWVYLDFSEDTFWVVEPEGEEREAFEFLRKFYSPSMGYSLEISRRILRDKLRQMGETSEKPSKIIQAGLLEYYREFLKRYPNSVYTPIVLDLYEFTCYGAGCPKEEWFGAYRRLILDFPDTYEAYTGVRGLTELVKGSGAKVTEEEVISILREVVEKHPNSLAALGVRKVITEGELMEDGGR